MPHYTVYHLSSGATTEVEFLNFDKADNSATCRYGLAGIYAFCLRSGQGRGEAKAWAIKDLETLREFARAEGLNPGIVTAAHPPHRTLGRKPRDKKPLPVDPRQPLLGGG